METSHIKSISIDPEIMSGTSVFDSTRVPVRSFFDWLETETLNKFLENFPSASREQALNVLHFAENLVTSPEILNENSAYLL
jgi:uncharacterized protein (DUF433 family)